MKTGFLSGINILRALLLGIRWVDFVEHDTRCVVIPT